MSDTPRTDAEFEKWLDSTQPYTDLAIFARQLERELNEARTRIKELADIGGALAAQIEVEAIDAPGSVRRVREWQETVKRCLEGIE